MFSDFKIHKNHDKLINELLEWARSICEALIVAITFLTFVARVAVVNGTSMEPTLLNGDMLIIRSIGYNPAQGDIIACNSYGLGKVIVKRIAAVGGQVVDIDFSAGKVYVDGEEFTVPGIENLTSDKESNLTYPLRVPSGKYFVLGDNRQHSTDSRNSAVGFIDRTDILGEAVFRLYPFKRAGKL